MTNPSQYPEKYTRPMRHIHHSTIVWLDSVVLEYADAIWNNCTQYESNEPEKIQNEAARIVTGATKLVSINSLLSETGWETLSSRRNKHKLTLLYKMQNDLSPEYLCSLVPPTMGSTSSYPLCNADDLHILQQTHNYTITPSYRLRFVNGTNSRLTLVICLVLIYLKRESTTTLAYHLLITSQARDLVKYITLDLDLNVAPCVITCFRKIL